jgi:hypothetical protein
MWWEVIFTFKLIKFIFAEFEVEFWLQIGNVLDVLIFHVIYLPLHSSQLLVLVLRRILPLIRGGWRPLEESVNIFMHNHGLISHQAFSVLWYIVLSCHQQDCVFLRRQRRDCSERGSCFWQVEICILCALKLGLPKSLIDRDLRLLVLISRYLNCGSLYPKTRLLP